MSDVKPLTKNELDSISVNIETDLPLVAHKAGIRRLLATIAERDGQIAALTDSCNSAEVALQEGHEIIGEWKAHATSAEATCVRLTAERDGEREAREKCSAALRAKDEAMGELFRRLSAAGVDCSDLIS